MKAGEIAAIIEELAPGHLQESWDNSGFTVGGAGREVNSALLALDCTPEVLQEAVERGTGMIITHHPLIFSPLKRIAGSNVVERMVETAIKNDIVIYSAHTNADKVLPGVSGLMAASLGLVNVEILDKEEGGDTGLGVVGDFVKPLSFSEVSDLVGEILWKFKSSRPHHTLQKGYLSCRTRSVFIPHRDMARKGRT